MRNVGSHDTLLVALPDPAAAIALAGAGESTLRLLESQTGTNLVLRGLDLLIKGKPAQQQRCLPSP
jgi:phosphate starvation-inducible protein PhoH